MDHVEQAEGETIRPQAMCSLIGKHAAENAIFCCDTGSVTSFFAKSLRVRAGQDVTLSGNLATMAYSVAAAIGVQLSHRHRQVITLTGDGSANMLMGELATLKKYDLPVKVFILNNGRLHLIDFEENVEGIPAFGTELQNPNFAAVAQAYGIKGLEVAKPDDLEQTISQALAYDGPVVVDVKVNPRQMLYPPKVTLGQAWGFSVAKIKEFWQSAIA
ncbi:MAG: thiamine pyrophosphate-dependent enzyme [Bryobacterales bacterium]